MVESAWDKVERNAALLSNDFSFVFTQTRTDQIAAAYAAAVKKRDKLRGPDADNADFAQDTPEDPLENEQTIAQYEADLQQLDAESDAESDDKSDDDQTAIATAVILAAKESAKRVKETKRLQKRADDRASAAVDELHSDTRRSVVAPSVPAALARDERSDEVIDEESDGDPMTYSPRQAAAPEGSIDLTATILRYAEYAKLCWSAGRTWDGMRAYQTALKQTQSGTMPVAYRENMWKETKDLLLRVMQMSFWNKHDTFLQEMHELTTDVEVLSKMQRGTDGGYDAAETMGMTYATAVWLLATEANDGREGLCHHLLAKDPAWQSIKPLLPLVIDGALHSFCLQCTFGRPKVDTKATIIARDPMQKDCDAQWMQIALHAFWCDLDAPVLPRAFRRDVTAWLLLSYSKHVSWTFGLSVAVKTRLKRSFRENTKPNKKRLVRFVTQANRLLEPLSDLDDHDEKNYLKQCRNQPDWLKRVLGRSDYAHDDKIFILDQFVDMQRTAKTVMDGHLATLASALLDVLMLSRRSATKSELHPFVRNLMDMHGKWRDAVIGRLNVGALPHLRATRPLTRSPSANVYVATLVGRDGDVQETDFARLMHDRAVEKLEDADKQRGIVYNKSVRLPREPEVETVVELRELSAQCRNASYAQTAIHCLSTLDDRMSMEAVDVRPLVFGIIDDVISDGGGKVVLAVQSRAAITEVRTFTTKASSESYTTVFEMVYRGVERMCPANTRDTIMELVLRDVLETEDFERDGALTKAANDKFVELRKARRPKQAKPKADAYEPLRSAVSRAMSNTVTLLKIALKVDAFKNDTRRGDASSSARSAPIFWTRLWASVALCAAVGLNRHWLAQTSQNEELQRRHFELLAEAMQELVQTTATLLQLDRAYLLPPYKHMCPSNRGLVPPRARCVAQPVPDWNGQMLVHASPSTPPCMARNVVADTGALAETPAWRNVTVLALDAPRSAQKSTSEFTLTPEFFVLPARTNRFRLEMRKVATEEVRRRPLADVGIGNAVDFLMREALQPPGIAADAAERVDGDSGAQAIGEVADVFPQTPSFSDSRQKLGLGTKAAAARLKEFQIWTHEDLVALARDRSGYASEIFSALDDQRTTSTDDLSTALKDWNKPLRVLRKRLDRYAAYCGVGHTEQSFTETAAPATAACAQFAQHWNETAHKWFTGAVAAATSATGREPGFFGKTIVTWDGNSFVAAETLLGYWLQAEGNEAARDAAMVIVAAVCGVTSDADLAGEPVHLFRFCKDYFAGNSKLPFWLEVLFSLRWSTSRAIGATLTLHELLLLGSVCLEHHCPLGNEEQKLWQALPFVAKFSERRKLRLAVETLLQKTAARFGPAQCHYTGAFRLAQKDVGADDCAQYARMRSATTPLSVARSTDAADHDETILDLALCRNVDVHDCLRVHMPRGSFETPSDNGAGGELDVLWRRTCTHALPARRATAQHRSDLQKNGYVALSLSQVLVDTPLPPPSTLQLPYAKEAIENMRDNNNRKRRIEKEESRPMMMGQMFGCTTNSLGYTFADFAAAVARVALNFKVSAAVGSHEASDLPTSPNVRSRLRNHAVFGLEKDSRKTKQEKLFFEQGIFYLKKDTWHPLSEDATGGEVSLTDAMCWFFSTVAAYHQVAKRGPKPLRLPSDSELCGLSDINAMIEALQAEAKQRLLLSADDGGVSDDDDVPDDKAADEAGKTALAIRKGFERTRDEEPIRPDLQRATIRWWWHISNRKELHQALSARDLNRNVGAQFASLPQPPPTPLVVEPRDSSATAALVRDHDQLWVRTRLHWGTYPRWKHTIIDGQARSLGSSDTAADALYGRTSRGARLDRPTFTKRDSEYKSNGHKLLQHQLLFGFTLGCPYLSAQHGWRNAVDEMTADLADVHRAWLELDNRDAELLYLPSTVSTRQLVGATDANFDPELLIT